MLDTIISNEKLSDHCVKRKLFLFYIAFIPSINSWRISDQLISVTSCPGKQNKCLWSVSPWRLLSLSRFEVSYFSWDVRPLIKSREAFHFHLSSYFHWCVGENNALKRKELCTGKHHPTSCHVPDLERLLANIRSKSTKTSKKFCFKFCLLKAKV